MSDLKITAGSFASTSLVVEPLTDAGRKFFWDRVGVGAVSATFYRSYLGEIVTAARRENLVVEIV